MEAERVWLVHRDGFASAGLLKNDKDRNKEGDGSEVDVGDGKVRVQLDYNGDIIEVKIISRGLFFTNSRIILFEVNNK